MLVRAATRRIPRDVLRNQLRPSSLPHCEPPSSNLQLLCASKTRNSPFRYASTSTSAPVRPSKRPLDAASDSTRKFQTNAAVAPEPEYEESISYTSPQKRPAVGLDNLIILDTPPPPTIHEAHSGSTMLVEKMDIISSYHACIQADKLARAQLVLQQLHSTLDPDAPELTTCHNAFLHALLKKARDDRPHVQAFFMWYEERMKGKYGVAANSDTVSLLLKGSLLLQDEKIGKAYLKNYYKLATDLKIPPADLFEKDVFTKEDVKYITRALGVKLNLLSPEQQKEILEHIEVKRPEVLSVPEVIPTSVKGHGLDAIKRSLRSLIDPEYIPGLQDPNAEPISPIERQQLLEEDAIASSIERWKKEFELRQARGVLAMGKSLNVLLYEWHTAFVPLIKQELNRVYEAEKTPDKVVGNGDRSLYGPFMRLLTPEKLSVITMLEVLKVCNEGSVIADGVKSSKAVMSVGTMLENEVLAEEIQKKYTKQRKDQLNEVFSSTVKFNMFVRRERIRSQREEKATADYTIRPEWPTIVKAKLGAVLISMLIHCAKINVEKEVVPGERVSTIQPAFLHNYQYVRGRKLGVIKLNVEISRKLGIEPLRGNILSRHLPMIVPPRPWLGPRDGGYYYSPVKAVRTKHSREQDLYVQTAAARGDLEQLFAGLDVLGATSWAINERVFNIILQVWNSGENVAEIPPRELKIILPPEPENADQKARIAWSKEMKQVAAEKMNHHSLRCDVNFKMEIARAFVKEKFFFPHNVDFRGRAYPIPPHLNHIGNDLCRGLLMFDEGKELGERGLRWLKIHLSNVYGFDKASFTEREQFATDHLADIIDSCENPLTGKRWWLEAEDPWQCLAACFAVKDACELPDPSKYKCRLPVAQDGTCNGLQHYAALGGDAVGARQVNLEPSDRPQDVYTGVAELVKKSIQADCEAGNEMAIRLKDLITRKVVKQTVMTNVYGVTFIGAKAQIANQLKVIPAMEGMEINPHAVYLTRKVFDCVRSMFNGAHHIQDWLGQCAWRISRSISPTQMVKFTENVPTISAVPRRGRPRAVETSPLDKKLYYMTSVVWTTPLGLPVVQPYRQKATQLIPTHLQNLFISDPNIIDQVNSRKQLTAFPPNYIHSLDATHMLLSALECHKQGLTFAAVHDSFWTHPGDVDTLNRILRDAFINLHSSDLITKLHQEFQTRYAGFKFLSSFPETSAVGARIKMHRMRVAAARGKALTASEELLIEMERDQLLQSEDPEDQKKGREMITAASIAEAATPEEIIEGSASEAAEEEIRALVPKDTKVDMEAMTEKESPAQIVKLGSEEDVPGANFDVNAEEDLDAIDEDESEDPIVPMANAGNSAAEGEEEDMFEPTLEEVDTTSSEKKKRRLLGEANVVGTGRKGRPQTERDSEPGKERSAKRKRIAKSSSRPLRSHMKVNVWMPITFPDVPAKGTFEVSRLEHSQYFFS
ncbi:hypothetical protein DFH27DRAFT_575857 [Peziza echinospora]|nr:hypothetical protein DFH27DRAFT_575857 [Peziza echinospora]